MMLGAHVAEWLVEEYQRQARREAEAYRLVRKAGIGRQGGVSRSTRRVLGVLGRILVRVGGRLESYGSAPLSSRSADARAR